MVSLKLSVFGACAGGCEPTFSTDSLTNHGVKAPFKS